MIVAPARAASWTAKLPTPPAAPTIRIVSPFESASASTAASAAMPASGATPATARSSEAGFGATCISAGECNQLGPASFVDGGICVQEEAEDLVAHRITLDVRADCFDGARVVTAEDD